MVSCITKLVKTKITPHTHTHTERERETDRQTDREREREREIERERERERERDRDRDRDRETANCHHRPVRTVVDCRCVGLCSVLLCTSAALRFFWTELVLPTAHYSLACANLSLTDI
jgi:hypothetical protein